MNNWELTEQLSWRMGAVYVNEGRCDQPSMCISSAEFSRSVMTDSLKPHGQQHARPPFHHQLPEFTQTHVQWVSDAIQPSHPLSSPSPSTFNLSQHQGLFKLVSSSNQVAKVLELQLHICPSNEYLGLISLQSKGLSRVFSNTTVQKHQFFSTQISL